MQHETGLAAAGGSGSMAACLGPQQLPPRCMHGQAPCAPPARLRADARPAAARVFQHPPPVAGAAVDAKPHPAGAALAIEAGQAQHVAVVAGSGGALRLPPVVFYVQLVI